MADWESQIAGERMAVDGEFSDRVASSSLSSQQWNLVMTAVNFEIRNPGTPTDAELVADTSKLPSLMDEIDRVGAQAPMGGGQERTKQSDGLLSGLLSTLGLSDSSTDEIREEAEQLASEYADLLQSELVERGRWEQICERAASN